MQRNTINFDTVRDIALTLPGVEEGTAYGVPALKVHGKRLACVPANRSARPDSLVDRVDLEDRAETCFLNDSEQNASELIWQVPSIL